MIYLWSRREFLTCGQCSPLSREGNRHPLEMPSNHRAFSPLLILRTSFRTSYLSTPQPGFMLLLKVTI